MAASRLKSLRFITRIHPPVNTSSSSIRLISTFNNNNNKQSSIPILKTKQNYCNSSKSKSNLLPLIFLPFLLGSTTFLLQSEEVEEKGLNNQLITNNNNNNLKTTTIFDQDDEQDQFLNSTLNESNLISTSKPIRYIRRMNKFLIDYIIEPLSTTRRFIHLVILFFPVLITSPILLLEMFDGNRDRKRGRARRDGERITTTWWYKFLVGQMERAGPTFIKLAQWAGSRTDLFPSSLCILFGKLHSNGKPHSFSHTKRVIERAFNLPFSSIFSDFSPVPMGIGAIAQVYKAVLNSELELPLDYLGNPKHVDDPSRSSRISRVIVPSAEDGRPHKVPGSTVAIKVLHPGVEKMISRDLKIMMAFATILNAFPGMEWLSFPEEVTVFGEMMMSQLDLRIEANNLKTFEDNFRHFPTVSFPRPLKRFTSPQVLTEEFEDAVPLESFLQAGGGPFDDRIANLGLDAFLNMLLIMNWVHGDLHPGNIMVKFFKPTTKTLLSSLYASIFDTPEPDSASSLTANSSAIVARLRSVAHDKEAWLSELNDLDLQGYEPEIVFIDAGLVTHLNDKNRRDFLDLFSAVAQFDGYKAGRLMVERCRAPELVIEEETFALRMQHLVLSVKSQTFSLAKIRIANILSEVLHNVREHHVKLEADFVNTVISILLLEGIGRQLDPEMDLFKSALPIMRTLGKQVGASGMMSGAGSIDAKSLGTMLKVWLWIEARSLASIQVVEVDDMVRYDGFMPNM